MEPFETEFLSGTFRGSRIAFFLPSDSFSPLFSFLLSSAFLQVSLPSLSCLLSLLTIPPLSYLLSSILSLHLLLFSAPL